MQFLDARVKTGVRRVPPQLEGSFRWVVRAGKRTTEDFLQRERNALTTAQNTLKSLRAETYAIKRDVRQQISAMRGRTADRLRVTLAEVTADRGQLRLDLKLLQKPRRLTMNA